MAISWLASAVMQKNTSFPSGVFFITVSVRRKNLYIKQDHRGYFPFIAVFWLLCTLNYFPFLAYYI